MKISEIEVKRHYEPSVKEMHYFTPHVEENDDVFNSDVDKMNSGILKNFYVAVEWLLKRGYDEYKEIQSNTINPAQQNAFIPLREYRVKRNGHYKTVKIFQRFSGGCCITETDF